MHRLLFVPLLLVTSGIGPCHPQGLGSTRMSDAGNADGQATNGVSVRDPLCPATVPASNSACPKEQLVCIYPGGVNSEGTYHLTALCDPGSGPSWQVVPHLERQPCPLAGAPGRALAITDCAARTSQACDTGITETPQELLDRQLSIVAETCGGIPNESQFEVDFTGGCAAQVTLQAGILDYAAFYDCLSGALAPVRFACAQGLECGRLHPSTLP